MTRVVACVACLDPARSVHTPTFTAAVEIAGLVLADSGARLALFDDSADAGTARCVAETIVASKPDCVVGHFASAAAAAAAPIYEASGIPLLLPAATMSALNRFRSVYRICDNDTDYAQWLAHALAGRGLVPVRYASDGSAHGESVIAALRAEFPAVSEAGNPAIVFAGRYAETIAFAGKLASSATEGAALVVTDDADAPSLAADLAAAGLSVCMTPVYLAALRPGAKGRRAELIRQIYRERHGAEPGTYFWETVAAIEMAIAMPLAEGDFVDTVLGPLRPDSHGECRPQSFRLVRVGMEGIDD